MSRAAVIVVSDRAAAGAYEDRSGPVVVAALRAGGFECADATVVADGADSVADAIRAALDSGARLVVTSGGTGVGPRDRTPEGTRPALSRELPGLAEALRRAGEPETPMAMVSRGLAGVVDEARALVVNLPGNPAAVTTGIPVILAVARHVIGQLDGAGHASRREGRL